MLSPVIIVIQARLSSTRLPGKALLQLAGRPVAVLCAQRAMNTGLPVVVATSDELVDDPLAAVLTAAHVKVVRGSHHDVLARFVTATCGCPDDTVVVRLTADNVFPDGNFIEDIVRAFKSSDVDYLGTDSPDDGLPYGLSAEVFTVSTLRRADAVANTAFDREHVTPWIRRSGRSARYRAEHLDANWSRDRCTLDNFDDYRRLNRVFDGIENPLTVGWRELAVRLNLLVGSDSGPRCPYRRSRDGRLHSALTLGTVQLGLSYGIANHSGMPDDDETRRLLQDAIDAGVSAFDTARAYGVAEERLGTLLSPGYRDRVSIITKLDVLSEIPEHASRAWVRSAVDASVLRSCVALKSEKLDTLLLHRWAHHGAWEGAVWERLLELQRDGLIRVLGASVSSPEEALAALDDPQVTHLQCPVNLLDWRWRSDSFQQAVQRRPEVIIHARSVLLQGLLGMDAAAWPNWPNFDVKSLCDVLDKLVMDLGRVDRIDLCLAYARALPWVTSVVVGMEHSSQLRANLAYAQATALDAEQLRRVHESLPRVPEWILNPAQWKQAHE